MTTTRRARFQTIGGTVAEWAADDIVPLVRELALETDTGKFKFGDGVTAYSALPYGSGVAWGGVTGTLSDQADLQAALNAKEPTIAGGTTGQYLRGDKSWQPLDKAAVGLGNLSNTVTGTGGVVLATSPTIVTPAVTTSISISASSVARIFFTSDNAGTPKLARFEQDTSGNMVFRNETSGGQFIDAFNGVITFRNYGGGSATLFRISTTDVRAGCGQYDQSRHRVLPVEGGVRRECDDQHVRRAAEGLAGRIDARNAARGPAHCRRDRAVPLA